MVQQDNIGEGNREADRRYRKGVRDTVENTSASDRADAARQMNEEELEKARQAEKEGKSRARR